MKIILSPSKTQADPKKAPLVTQETILDLESTLMILKKLKKLSRKKLAETMKLDGKLLEKTYRCYQDFNPETSLKLPSIHLYTGLVFDQIQLDTYNEDQIAYLNDHLRILSAMYGLLHPQALIWPYRLDLTMTIPTLKLRSLWSGKIAEALKEETLIIDLSSQEFSVCLAPLGNKVHHVIFLEDINGKERIISANAKKIRGKMADYLITHQITDLSRLTEFDIDGYHYQTERSSGTCSIFIKKTVS